MSREALEDLMDLWIEDPTFREALRADPEKAVRQLGVILSADEMQSLKAMDEDSPGDELQPRVSRS